MAERGTRTKRKLEEAKFFLDQLRPNYGKEKKFDFFLSAFISATRSVTWVMGAEYGDVPGHKEWFENLKPSEAEERLLKGTNTLRVRTQKLGPPDTLKKMKVSGVNAAGGDLEGLKAALREHDGPLRGRVNGTKGNYVLELQVGDKVFLFPAAHLEVMRELDEFPGENILTICENYYESVSKVVAECRGKFDG